MKKFFKILIWIAVLAGIISASEFFVLRKKSKQPVPRTQNNISAPPQNETAAAIEIAAPETKTANNPDSSPILASDTAPASSTDPLPEKILLEIPFYSQAPFSRWDAFHEDMCEEASILNAAYYLLGKKPSKEEYEKELQKMKQFEEKEIGEWKSTTIAQTKKLVDVYFEGKIRSRIIDNPTVEDIKSEVAAGNPVVVPLSGRDIGNPNFTPPGPVYHMLIVKGYNAQNFIANDVGTRKGNSYVYKKEVLMKNIHDWNEKDIHLGGKRVLVLY